MFHTDFIVKKNDIIGVFIITVLEFFSCFGRQVTIASILKHSCDWAKAVRSQLCEQAALTIGQDG